MTGERCIHDFVPDECGLCRPRGPAPAPPDRQVWVLPTSERYHRQDCYMFDAAHERGVFA